MANRYKDQSAANEIGMEAIDAGFIGVNTQLDPGLLKTGAAYSNVNQVLAGPGLCSHARNMRFRRGVAETRQGTVAPTWCNPRNPDAGHCQDSVVNAIVAGSDLLHPDYEGIFVQSGTLFTWLPRRADDVNSRAVFQWNVDAATVARVQYNGTQWLLQTWPDTVAGDAGATTLATTTAATTDPWTSTWPAGTQVFKSPWVEPWTERILASAQFADPDGTESLMLVFPSAIYQCREGISPIRIGLPAGIQLQEPVELLQTFDSMVLLRGFDQAPLAWDGSADKFAPIPAASPSGDYTASIPNSETGAVMSNRLFLVSGRDTIAVSDILNFTRYDDALNEFRINTGEDDAITGIFPFRRTNLLVFKTESVHLISNVSGDLSNIAAEIVNSEVGCPAPKSIAAVGGDVYFLSDDGIFQLSEVVEQSMQVQERPVSEPIDSLIKRINWNAVDTCRATVHGDYYRLAVPLDGATRPNAVLVYDTVRGAWQGYDDYPANFRPDILGRTNSLGRKHAYAIDKETATVVMLDQGTTDAVAYEVSNIHASLTTSFVGNNNDITLTALQSGSAGNTISLAVSAATLDTTVGVVGHAITVTRGDLTWKQRNSNGYWQSIATSSDGSKIVAGTASEYVYTSTDGGITWIQRDAVRNWNAITSSADGSKLAAATSTTGIVTSTDGGITWTERETAFAWRWIAGSSDGTKLVAIRNTSAQIYTSTDSGVTWTPRESSRAWISVASSADGVMLVALVYNGKIYTSTDSGVTWTPRESNRAWRSVASSADGLKLVATVTGGKIYTSTDSGVTWTPREIDRSWYGVACSSDGLTISAMVLGGQVYTSSDGGLTWVARLSAGWWYSTAMSADGSKILAGPSIVSQAKIFVGTTTNASDIIAAINADNDANDLVTATLATGNNGTGAVATMAQTYLSGGFNAQGIPYPGVIQEKDITSEIQTRGYILLDDGPKRFRHGMVTLETWNPSYTIDIVTDGYNEIETVVGPRTKDRTKYYLHGKADYDTTNINQDFDVAKREDYSVVIPAAGVDLDMGLRPAQMQQCQEQFVVRRMGQWCAIRITNTQGRLALKNASMDGQNKRNMARTFA